MNNFKHNKKITNKVSLYVVLFFIFSLFTFYSVISTPVSAQDNSNPSCPQVCAVAREEGLTEIGDGVASGLCCCIFNDQEKQSLPFEQCDNLQ